MLLATAAVCCFCLVLLFSVALLSLLLFCGYCSLLLLWLGKKSVKDDFFFFIPLPLPASSERVVQLQFVPCDPLLPVTKYVCCCCVFRCLFVCFGYLLVFVCVFLCVCVWQVCSQGAEDADRMAPATGSRCRHRHCSGLRCLG